MKSNIDMKKVWFIMIMVFIWMTILIVALAHKANQRPATSVILPQELERAKEETETMRKNREEAESLERSREKQKEYEQRRSKWKPVPEKEKDLSLDAWCCAQRFVEQDLKCPRTVKWPWISYSKATTNLGNGRYRCASYFDAQNSFGAMVRTNFVCVVKFTGGTQWQLESLTF